MRIKRWNYMSCPINLIQHVSTPSPAVSVTYKPGPRRIVVPIKEVDALTESHLARYGAMVKKGGSTYWW